MIGPDVRANVVIIARQTATEAQGTCSKAGSRPALAHRLQPVTEDQPVDGYRLAPALQLRGSKRDHRGAVAEALAGRGPMTTSPADAAACSRAARLRVSPITVKLRWRSAPTSPTTAGPVFTAMRNRGQLECSIESVTRSAPHDGAALAGIVDVSS
jgi:hypothetical protein